MHLAAKLTQIGPEGLRGSTLTYKGALKERLVTVLDLKGRRGLLLKGGRGHELPQAAGGG